ncbi:unnamed protein product, partial [Prorocentrum cordatum]
STSTHNTKIFNNGIETNILCIKIFINYVTDGIETNTLHVQGTHRIPPAWQPGADYTFRDWERDVTNWIRLTDLQADQIGGTIYQRVSGLAKTLLRDIPDNVISYGADGRP